MGNELSCSEGRACETDNVFTCFESRQQMPGHMVVRLVGKDGQGVELSGSHSGRPNKPPAFKSEYLVPATTAPSYHEEHRKIEFDPLMHLPPTYLPTAGESPRAPQPRSNPPSARRHKAGNGDGSPENTYQGNSQARQHPQAPSGPSDHNSEESDSFKASPPPSAAEKGGWIQMSLTISDMSIAGWTQGRQDAFIETVALTTHVPLSDICVLALKEKCGRRLLSNALEITFQVKANSLVDANMIVNELNNEAIDQMMLQAGFRLRPDVSRKADNAVGTFTPRDSSRGSAPFDVPFRNGYSLTDQWQLHRNSDRHTDSKSSSRVDGASDNRKPTAVKDSMLL